MSTEPNTETTGVQATNVPIADLDYLKPYALRNAYGPTRGATMRYALVELAKRYRRENGDSPAGGGDSSDAAPVS